MLPTYKRSWILGENKYVELEVRSKRAESIVVSQANWTLTQDAASEAEQTGTCEVNGGLISALVEPRQTGAYTLEITYKMPPETRKVRVMLDVH